MGDVAGVGPEIIARAWPELTAICRPVVVGDPGWMEWAVRLVGLDAVVQPIRPGHAPEPTPNLIPCLLSSSLRRSAQDLSRVEPGRVTAEAGQAAYDFLCIAIKQILAGAADGIVTAPLHKEGLRAAGLPYPGHTEILAAQTGTGRFAMMLYAGGLGVIHVTLHMALREVFQHLTRQAVLEKIQLLDRVMTRLLERRPRIGVAGLNPHASDGGMFGDEEATIIKPAVAAAYAVGIEASGPWPADTLFVRTRRGEFDGIVAMYHDQGHIPMKLLAGFQLVNISVGLPLVRTSVAHGTAYDIAGLGKADATSLVEATRVAALLARR